MTRTYAATVTTEFGERVEVTVKAPNQAAARWSAVEGAKTLGLIPAWHHIAKVCLVVET